MAISKDTILELRSKTGAGVMDCKQALAQAGGDLKEAMEFLRKKGIDLAAKKSTRATKEGRIASYVHLNGRIGVLIEVNSETDFVARNEVFRKFVKDVTMQIAAQRPFYLSREDVPKEIIDSKAQAFRAQIQGKSEEEAGRFVNEKLEKFFQETCLLEQPFIKNLEITIKDYLTSVIAKTRENIVIRRFTRYELGEEIKTVR